MDSARSSRDNFLPQGPAPVKKSKFKGKILGVAAVIAVIVIIAVVVGVVLGTHKKDRSSNDGAGSSGVPGSVSSAISAKLAFGRFATATDSEFMVPLYPSTVSH